MRTRDLLRRIRRDIAKTRKTEAGLNEILGRKDHGSLVVSLRWDVLEHVVNLAERGSRRKGKRQ
jgi:hypothetical protein